MKKIKLSIIFSAIFSICITNAQTTALKTSESCSSKTKGCTNVTMSAIKDFNNLSINTFVTAYKDNTRNAIAIDAAIYKDKVAASESVFRGASGNYNITITTLTELDGESSYNLYVDGKMVGNYQNPSTTVDYRATIKTFENIEVSHGATIRVSSNSTSNGKIPEGNGFAYSRGRWSKLDFECIY